MNMDDKTSTKSPPNRTSDGIVEPAQLPRVDDLGHHLIRHQNEPVVFCNAISDWPAASWTPETLNTTLMDHPITFRIGTKKTSEVEWEADCDFVTATLEQFVDWLKGGTTEPSNPLSPYDSDTRWCYCDYKHIPKEFPDKPELLKAVDWSSLGFPGRSGAESTLWLGSTGAHTQCHYDTYGCNLVAQVYGRKRWVLFPPSHTKHLYPTRVPYEESSVYSKVNVTKPNLHQHPKFKETSPVVVTLEPGDVLYVPRHWWHDVTSLSTSISVNTWIELSSDSEERLKEAITRTVVMAMVNQQTDNITWLNQNEEYTDYEENLDYLSKAVLLNKKPTEMCKNESLDDSDGPTAKRQRLSPNGDSCSCNSGYTKIDLKSRGVKCPTSCTFSQYRTFVSCEPGDSMSTDPENDGLSMPCLGSALLESLTHPDVIRMVCGILQNRMSAT